MVYVQSCVKNGCVTSESLTMVFVLHSGISKEDFFFVQVHADSKERSPVLGFGLPSINCLPQQGVWLYVSTSILWRNSASKKCGSLKILVRNSSVIRQKDESQNRGNKKTKHVNFSEKINIFYPLIRTRMCAYQGLRNVSFFGKFAIICFLVTSVFRFSLLPYYRRIEGGFSRGRIVLYQIIC